MNTNKTSPGYVSSTAKNKDDLDIYKQALESFQNKILEEFQEIRSDTLCRDLFIVMQRDFLYVNGSYDKKKLHLAHSCFLDIYNEIQNSVKPKTSEKSLLFESINHISKSIHKMLSLKNDLQKDFQTYFDSYKANLYLNETQLSEITEKLKSDTNLAQHLQQLKCETISSMHRGIISFLVYIWRKEKLGFKKSLKIPASTHSSLNLKKQNSNTNTRAATGPKPQKSTLDLLKYKPAQDAVSNSNQIFIDLEKIKKMLYTNTNIKNPDFNELIFKKSSIALDLHELIVFLVCIIRENLRAKDNRSFSDQEKRPMLVDLLLFTIIDLLKLQLQQDLSSIKQSNICKLFNFVEYAGPIQCLSFFTFIYFLNYMDPIDPVFSSHGDLHSLAQRKSNLEEFVYLHKEKSDHSRNDVTKPRIYNHYLLHLWHKSIVDRNLYFSYLQFIKVYNRLKALNSNFSKTCTINKLKNDLKFDETLSSSTLFYEFFYHFQTSNYIIFNSIKNEGYKDNREVYNKRHLIMKKSAYDSSKPNILTLSKESINSNYHGNVLIDVFSELVEFYELLVIFTNKQANMKKKNDVSVDKPAFNSSCQESFQIVRDISLLVFKATLHVTEYIYDKHSLLKDNSKYVKNNQNNNDDVYKTLVFCRVELKKFLEHFGIHEKYNQDIDTFLHADFKDVFLYYTMLILEVLMYKTDFKWDLEKDIKMILYDMIKFIKILPSMNTFFLYYESDIESYFQRFASAFTMCMVEYGENVYKYNESKKN
jgi:hypothetical protein